jgi:hypothetical protein
MADAIPLYQQYLIRRGALSTERATWLPQYREISQFIMPRTGRFLLTDQNKGDKRYNSIIDSTGTRALRVLAAGLMAGMTSPARPWFRLSTLDTDLMEYGPVKLWLNVVTEKMRTIFSRSNTYRSLHTIYEELGLYGTAAHRAGRLRRRDAPLPEHVRRVHDRHRFAQQVNTLYREFQMTVAALVGEFGLANVSAHVRDMWDAGRNLDAWIPVLHVIEPHRPRLSEFRASSRNLPWSTLHGASANLEPKRPASPGFLRESGFKRFPALCPRWHATGGDIYGNSPGMEALGDVKQLQHGQMRKSAGRRLHGEAAAADPRRR